MQLPHRHNEHTSSSIRGARSGGLWAIFSRQSQRRKVLAVLGLLVVLLCALYGLLALSVGGSSGGGRGTRPRPPIVGRHSPNGAAAGRGGGVNAGATGKGATGQSGPLVDTAVLEALQQAKVKVRAGLSKQQEPGHGSYGQSSLVSSLRCKANPDDEVQSRTCQEVVPDAQLVAEQQGSARGGIGRGFVALENSGALFLEYLLIQAEHLQRSVGEVAVADGQAPWVYDRLNGFPTVHSLDDLDTYRVSPGRDSEPNEPGSSRHRLPGLWYGHVSRLASSRYPFDSMVRVAPVDRLRDRAKVNGPDWCGNSSNRHGSALFEDEALWRREGFGKKPLWWDDYVARRRRSAGGGDRRNHEDENDEVGDLALKQLPRQCRTLVSGPMDEILGFFHGSRRNVHAKCPGYNDAGDGCGDRKNGDTPGGCHEWRLAVLVRDPRDVLLSMFETRRGPTSKFAMDVGDCPWLGSANDVDYGGREGVDLCELFSVRKQFLHILEFYRTMYLAAEFLELRRRFASSPSSDSASQSNQVEGGVSAQLNAAFEELVRPFQGVAGVRLPTASQLDAALPGCLRLHLVRYEDLLEQHVPATWDVAAAEVALESSESRAAAELAASRQASVAVCALGQLADFLGICGVEGEVLRLALESARPQAMKAALGNKWFGFGRKYFNSHTGAAQK
eukprot:INCI9930.1.p1 GENE.INCI9930.1~~INCI9930.1.p1  ORF type:complete len:674 (-),score=114.08 INCI9930.1:253-2274(-)